jgi:tryptophan halogenase
MKRIVIIGGGTSGWITALFSNKFFSDDVTLVESSSIDILGAGEGTTPSFRKFLRTMDINFDDFIKETNATYKDGIEFVNWGENKNKFVHDFLENNYAFHFNARKTADFFKNIGLSRGVKWVDGTVNDFITDKNGDINQIVLTDGNNLSCDFLFDCSGFSRMVIGKFYNSKWKPYTENLICDKAFSFFLPQTENLEKNTKLKTKAIAMKYGWMWMIPLQDRFGCGYVFSSKHTNIDHAKKEVVDFLGKEIDIVKSFDFNPGCYEKIWINNTIAFGLSAGFVEPLEATSIMSLLLSLDDLLKIGLNNVNDNKRDKFNKLWLATNQQIFHFLIHHYNCGRTDTSFWSELSAKKLPEWNVKMLDEQFYNNPKNYYKYNLLEWLNLQNIDIIFTTNSYKVVLEGHKSKKNEKSLI